MVELRLTGRNLLTYSSTTNGGIELKSYEPQAELYFVLLQGPDGKGYLRCDTGPNHAETYSRMGRLLRKFGYDTEEFKPKGGGLVSIWRKKGHIDLLFQGTTFEFGKYDRSLLEAAVMEVFDPKLFKAHYEQFSVNNA